MGACFWRATHGVEHALRIGLVHPTAVRAASLMMRTGVGAVRGTVYNNSDNCTSCFSLTVEARVTLSGHISECAVALQDARFLWVGQNSADT
jgi:hypothetical protein